MAVGWVLVLAALSAGPSAQAATPWQPMAAGAAACAVDANTARVANAVVRLSYARSGRTLQRSGLWNGYTRVNTALDGPLFSLKLRDGTVRTAADFSIVGTPRCTRVSGNAQAARGYERRNGMRLGATFTAENLPVRVEWTAELRDDASFARETFRFESNADLDVASVILLDSTLVDAEVPGTSDGLPITAGDAYFGFEHPMSLSRTHDGRAMLLLRRELPLRTGVAATYSTVLGASPAGQMRRGFSAYLEDARAHPFRTFLHYNSWYDIGYFTPYSEQDALRVIQAYGAELVSKRGVRMDSFLFDDGWDDTARLWQFHSGFPQGFAPLKAAAAKFDAAPGMWLSPWGGYGPPRKARLQTATAAGCEVDSQGLALSGPRYYPLFRETTLRLLREGVNQFKLDGVGSPDKNTPGSAFDSDFAAAIALIDDLRAAKPDLFINLTTGTWPSPFWLRTADSIWRGGEDHAFLGHGSDRQRWITYRDADTYGGVVRVSPLFPLNSLMLHGIIYARHARGLDKDPAGDFAQEVWTYFASGTGLQEMYISPDLLQPGEWDTLASAARWARERADTLRDSHWIGGDPARGEVYGWAAWSEDRSVIALRNPGASPQSYLIDLQRSLELPSGVLRLFRAAAAYGRFDADEMTADRPLEVRLAPHEVIVVDLLPQL
jgi:hypothetical protein